MKKSTGAALLSALVFPGVGHLFLKQHARGAGLLITSLAALAIVVRAAYQRALTIAERVVTGDMPLDVGAIAEAAAESSGTDGSLTLKAAVIVVTICWLIGIADAYRIGAVQEDRGLTDE